MTLFVTATAAAGPTERRLWLHCAAALALGAVPLARGVARADPAAGLALGLLRTGDLGGLPVLDLVAGGMPGRWLVDTGASAHVVDRTWARRLGLRESGTTRLSTVAGVQTVPLAALPPFEGAGPRGEGLGQAMVLDLGPYRGATGEEVAGVLGLPWLAAQPVQFDFADGRLRLGDEVAGPRPSDAAAKLVLVFDGGVPVVRLALGDREPEPFLVDTGFPGAVMVYSSRAGAWLGAAGRLPRLTVHEIGGQVNVAFARLRRVRLGPVTLSDVPAVLDAGTGQRRGEVFDRLAGAVGTALFESGRLTLDRAAGALQVAWPGGPPRLPGGFGMGLLVGPGGSRIGAVVDGGPAARARLQPGDRLVAADGRSVQGLRPSELWAAWRAADSLRLELERDGQRVHAELARERFFPPID